MILHNAKAVLQFEYPTKFSSGSYVYDHKEPSQNLLKSVHTLRYAYFLKDVGLNFNCFYCRLNHAITNI